jgi:hypothetical protein
VGVRGHGAILGAMVGEHPRGNVGDTFVTARTRRTSLEE